MRCKPHPRRIHELVIPSIHPPPDPQARHIEPQQRHHEAPHRSRQILRLTSLPYFHSERAHRCPQQPQPHKTSSARRRPHVPQLLSLLAREPVHHALGGLVSLRRQRQPRARAPHRQQHRVVLHAHQRHLQRHALELEGHAEIARLACASASNQAKTGRFEIEFRVVGDPGQRIALERLARGREAALAVDPVRGVEVEALLLRLRRQILEVFGLHDEALEGDRDVAKELEMDGERVGLQIFGMQGFLGDGIAIIIFMAFGDGEFGRIDSR